MIYLYILQLASFNRHAAKVPTTNHQRSSPSNIGSCKSIAPEIPTNPGLESSGTTQNMNKNPRRHCWECLRRRVVCDYTRPACNRCTKSGNECPGYGDVKPARLRWLPPGKVISRQSKRNGTADPENEKNPIVAATRNVDETVCPNLSVDTETRALLEAVEYYNTCIYQDLLPIHQLGQHPGIYLVTPTHLQIGAGFPEHIRLSLICTTLSHRINRLGHEGRQNALVESFYHFRGIIIRSLREDIEVRHNQNGDVLVAGIIALLLADAHQGASINWRHHLEGVNSLITLRGGLRTLSGSKTLDQLLLCFMLYVTERKRVVFEKAGRLTWHSVAILGNTTSPATDLAMAGSHAKDLDIIVNHYGHRVFSFQMCPPTLFAEIIKVNHLRMRAKEGGQAGVEGHSQEARNILDRIHTFSPKEWSESKPCSRDGWMLVGNIYQAAVSLYCMLSMQSLSVLPHTSEMKAQCAEYGRLLQTQLESAMSSPATRYSMIWPLVLLGVQAVNHGPPLRAFVSEKLPELSYHIGSNVPMVAKAVLERFWASGDVCWDTCFDRPHVFVTQIAVDMSQLVQHS